MKKKQELKEIKQKNYAVVIVEILIISIAIIGATLAVSRVLSNVTVNTAFVNAIYTETSNNSDTVELTPIDDATISTNTNNVLTIAFTVKGTQNNNALKEIIYDVSLSNITTSDSLLSKYTKWQLIKNDTLLSSGTLSTTFDTIKNGRLVLTEIQQDMPNYNSTADSYVFKLWISEACPESLTGCSEYVDQSNMLNQELTASISIDTYTGNKKALVRDPLKLDTSGANAPSIDSAYMVPVYYDSTSSNWKIADKDNVVGENAWYNYTDKQWANMVLVGASASSCTPGTDCLDSVTKHDRDYYTNQSNVGQPVSMDDILAFYVWIPRYKYKVWNINKIPQEDQAYTYNAYNDGIDIQWESGTDTSGNVFCTYYYTAPVATAGSPNETCTVAGDTSNPYYTHPAFTFGNDELTGIWVGKFETSSNTHPTGTSRGGGNVTNLTARIVPNVTSWRHIEIGNMFTVLQNMHNASNEYGLPTTKTSVDSHMMKNTEWGAVAYLTNSIYGKCTGLPGGCTGVQINGKGETSYYTAITGCGPSADGATARYETACTEYNTTTGILASTTGNITGVYDMSGGAAEYVMGNMSSATGAYTFYPSDTSGTMAVSWYTATTSKYVDTYAYDSSNYQGQIAYNRSRLGDATGEVNITGSSAEGWYSDNALFVVNSYSWFDRGGDFTDGVAAGAFNFDIFYGDAGSFFSFRASLVPLGAA